MNWTEIMKRGNVPESPGRQEVLNSIAERPYVPPVKKTKKR